MELSKNEIELLIETLEIDLNKCMENPLHLDNYHRMIYQNILAKLKQYDESI